VETSLLTTKLNIPPARPQLVTRPRLVERLQEGLNYNLILVSAPAGFGKTTLLSEWARQSQPSVCTAWVSLDEGDNDPVRFWDYFIAALQTIQPACGENTLTILRSTQTLSSQTPPIESVLTVLINDIASIPGNFVLALDDYHLIESQQIHDGITCLLEHIPAQMHLAIATRADPPLPLAHFRGRGTMLEIGADDLRFTFEDATSLFREMKTPELSAEDVAALNERTEGWAVGLKMAALSMSGQKDIPGFIAAFTGSQRYIMDYLMEEVLQKQTDVVRDFLVKTSILERLSGQLCDAITERQDSQDILLELERGHLFIVPLDESRQWYRYEHLFTDLLRHQCETAYGTEQVTDLHCRSSQWYEDHGFPDEAIHHALAAKDWETAMRLIYARCEELRKRGEWATLFGWFQQIPEEELRKQHRLYSQYASTLTVFSQVNAAETALTYLKNNVQDDANLMGEVLFSLSNLARMRGDIRRAIELAEKVLLILPPDNMVMRCRTNYIIGSIFYQSGLLPEAEVKLAEAVEIGQQAGEYNIVIGSQSYLGGIAHWRGQLQLAKKLLSNAPIFLSKVLYEINDIEGTVEKARLSIEQSEHVGIAEPRIVAYFYLARICLLQGDVSGAEALMIKMDQASQHPTVSPPYYARYLAGRVLLSIWQHNLDAAADWGSKLSENSHILVVEFQHVLPRLLLAQGRKEEAANLLMGIYKRFIQVGADGLAINIRVYQALAAGSEEAALEYISDALIQGESRGYVRTFVDEGELLKPLLEKALSKGITPEYTRKLLTIIEAEKQQRQTRKRENIAASGLLSEREIEILKLIAGGLSNRQIAEILFISLGTAKVHVHNLFEKLNVKSRTQVIARARKLKLI
jgi:LuxR family maltose regulon positive regulatory protein